MAGLSLPLRIGLRYARTRFSSWLSLAGVAVGVAALIAVLSVMNGLEGDLRSRLLSMGAQGTVLADAPQDAAGWAALEQRLRSAGLPLLGVAPFIEQQALLSRGPEMTGAMVRGIDPARESAVSDIGGALVEGRLDSLQPGLDRIVLGVALADRLGVRLGDSVTALVPGGRGALDLTPQLRTFTVAAIFEVRVADHDAGLALVHLADAYALLGGEGEARPSGLRLRFQDPLAVPTYRARLEQAAGPGFRVRDWAEDNATYFRAIRLEKLMVTSILLLVIGIAAFNIVAMLVMVVRAKRTDIAILRTLGLTPQGVMQVFVVQGLVIGWVGATLGVILGLLLAFNVGTIVVFLESTFQFHVFDPSIFYESAIPSDPHLVDVVAIAGAAFVLTLLATIYPARQAAATPPAVALRYE